MNFFVSNTSEKSCAFWKQHLLEAQDFLDVKADSPQECSMTVACRSDTESGGGKWEQAAPTSVDSTPRVSYPQCENLWARRRLFWSTQAFAWLHSPDGTIYIHCIYVVVGIVSTLEMVYNKAYISGVMLFYLLSLFFCLFFIFWDRTSLSYVVQTSLELMAGFLP